MKNSIIKQEFKKIIVKYIVFRIEKNLEKIYFVLKLKIKKEQN